MRDSAPNRCVSLEEGEYLHLISPPQDASSGIGAVSLLLHITQIETDAVLTVRVQDVLVTLVRGDRIIESQTIVQILDPRDLEPKIVSLRFNASQPGDLVVVDPVDTIPEIAEHNNRLIVQAPLPRI